MKCGTVAHYHVITNGPTNGLDNVAKDRKSQLPNVPTSQQPEKTRVTAYLDPVGSAVFSSLCDLWGKNSGDGLTMMVWAAFNGLESGQREAVAGMVRAKTGLSRLPSGPKTAKSVPEPSVGQGPSPAPGVVDSSAVVPALMARTTSITAMFNRAHAPIDEALDVIGGGN